jgi:antitoxin (DNA-binding transcriptional repressor) of toxin-antitoxin stability system
VTLDVVLKRGEAFTMTNRGKPVANLIPSRASNVSRTQLAISNILKAKKHRVSDEVLDELELAGRK